MGKCACQVIYNHNKRNIMQPTSSATVLITHRDHKIVLLDIMLWDELREISKQNPETFNYNNYKLLLFPRWHSDPVIAF